jgi:hypothetical protein
MAGTILISTEVGLPTSTVVFDYLVENLRKRLPPEIVASAYKPMDEGGMTFIDLKLLGPANFQHVLRAVTELYEAKEVAARKHPYFLWWERLLELLRADVRARSST